MKRLLIYTHDLSCNGANKHLCRVLPFLNKAFDTVLAINVPKSSEQLLSSLPKNLKRLLPLDGQTHKSASAVLTAPTNVFQGHIFLETPNILKAAAKLSGIIRTCNPDIVMSIGHKSNGTALLAKKLSPAAKKTTAYPNPTKYICLAQQHLSKQVTAAVSVKERYFYKALLKLYKSADLIVTACEGLAIDLSKTSPELVPKIKTVHNAGFDEDYAKLAPLPAGEKIFDKRMAAGKRRKLPGRKAVRGRQLELGFELPETHIITTCCNFSPRKNLSLLIKAFAKVHEKKQRSRLVIIGSPKHPISNRNTASGKELVNLKKLISQLKLESFIDLLPFHKNPYKYLAKSDVCVLPSLYEGFGTILTEAMVVGCPVISCNCVAGPNEIIEDNKNGFLVPVNDVSVLAQNILLLLGKHSLREKFKAAGLERAKMFSPQKSAEKLIKILETV